MTVTHLLPGPNADLWDWQLHGACRGANSEVFYHPDGERGRARTQREETAKAICATCPVIDACREHALRAAEPYGIWGGMSESERLTELRRRARIRTWVTS
ncbi:WhiB family transcriptional regulator [Corynebacterium uberis]|uniref:WhiB family transcriptional regulator n=1 Tax=Corynebacterium TaxID=1716 RepID=UPI001D0A69C6|nr:MULTISPECIES: WhiB family transcriptional regulator [Corynebacterium]MCZ9309329.1 WhiB family transcriptional regulator [Corynebacterium sp. c6VSa_13]UDL72879.1 WhiB family transcriptional regulator [Corynebacterium uberis]UDL76244.1 WhiB family transcriptional regulator [Corynebacterium uberis]UDL78456.1 WhiB family transcriptional regulator [Corynebacterium uberis]UDL80739.1 WhiB family transcriptional regulator [Corynebacterium uberis]